MSVFEGLVQCALHLSAEHYTSSYPSILLAVRYNERQISSRNQVKSSSYLDLIPCCPYVYTGTFCRLRALFTLLPRVAHAHSQLRAVAVERDRRHGGVVLRVLTQPLLQLVVPYRDGAVRTGGSEGVVTVTQKQGGEKGRMGESCGYVHRVECEGVDRPDVVHVIDSLAVALERVLLVLRFGAGVKVLHCYSALDRRGRITCSHGYGKTTPRRG